MSEAVDERPEILAAQRAGADEARLHQFLDEEPHEFAVCRCGWVGMGHLEHAARYIAEAAAWAALATREHQPSRALGASGMCTCGEVWGAGHPAELDQGEEYRQ